MKLNYISMITVMVFLITGCGSKSEEKKEDKKEAEPTEETVEDNTQPITTEGYEGTINGPEYADVRSYSEYGTRYPLIEITGGAFTIQKTTKTLDSLKMEWEATKEDKFSYQFLDYAEEGDGYFIARIKDNNHGDTIYELGHIRTIGTESYMFKVYESVTNIETIKFIMEFAKSYKKN